MIEEMKVNSGRKESTDMRQYDLVVVRGEEGSIQVKKVETSEYLCVDKINMIKNMSLL